MQKKHGGKPEYSEFHPESEMIFTSKETFEIPSNAHTDIRINVRAALTIPSKLLFLFETSHGYHELPCKDVLIVEIGKVDVYSVEYKLDYESKHRAKAVYYWKLLKELTRLLLVPNEDRIVGIRYIRFIFVSLKFDVVTQWVIG